MSRQIVHIVDDDNDVRESLALLLATEGFESALYPSAASFLDALTTDLKGCLLLDVKMPHMDGLEMQEVLRKRRVELPVIFMSGHGNIPTSVKALKGGALDFLEKPFDRGILFERIREAFLLDEENWVRRQENQSIFERYRSLTPREQEVFDQVIRGQSNKGIARDLDISHRTVELHRTRMMSKMQVKNVADLVAMALQSGLREYGNIIRAEKLDSED